MAIKTDILYYAATIHKLTDLTGTGAFVLSVWTTYGVMRYQHGKSLPLRKMLLAVGVSMWGVRLGGFLFSRILNSPGECNCVSAFHLSVLISRLYFNKNNTDAKPTHTT